MSGPKTSSYTLTAEQRRILAEQRRRELKIAEEKAKLKQIRSQFLTIGNAFTKAQERAKELADLSMSDNGFLEEYGKLANVVKKQLSELTEYDTFSLTRLEAVGQSANNTLAEVAKIQKRLNEIDALNFQQLNDTANKGIDSGFKLNFSLKRASSLDELKKAILMRLHDLSILTELNANLRSEINAAADKTKEISSENFLRNFNEITVLPLIKKCEGLVLEYHAALKKYNDLIVKYESLCENVGIVPESFEVSFEGITILEKRCSELEAEIESADEQEYISRCFDEVMEDMGYDLIGTRSVVKKSGKRFRNELYSFSNGSAVNVTFDAEGKITMELGGLSSSDRLPDSDETDRLCEDMRKFCTDYAEFEHRLEEKGVLSNHISLLPPQPEYAQIINISEYNMRSDVQTDNLADQRNSTDTNNIKRMIFNE